MCGITGIYSTSLALGEKDLFKRLLLLNVFRGEHSTGVVKIKHNPKFAVSVMKAAIASPEFVFSAKGSAFIDEKLSQVSSFIGHTRYATKGKITPENAHPFNFPNVVGVHNGTIRGKFTGSEDYETDSEALYALINKVGLVAALNEISVLDPAYALVFVDKKAGTLNFIRNSKRPLWFSFVAGRSTLIWSSAKEALDFAMENTSNVSAQSGWDNKDTDKHFYLKPYDLLQIKIGAPAVSAKIISLDIKEPPASQVTVYGGWSQGGVSSGSWIKGADGNYRPQAEEDARLARLKQLELAFSSDEEEIVQTSNKTTPAEVGDYANFHDTHGDLSDLPWLNKQIEQQSAKTPAKAKASTSKSVSVVSKTSSQYGTEPLSAAERNYKLSCGCFACNTVVDPADHKEMERIRWWSRDYYACGDCYEFSDGDWVKKTVDDLWEDTPKTGVQTH